MGADIPLTYVILGLLLASGLLTYLTHEPKKTYGLDEPAFKSRKPKKVKKDKKQERLNHQQPYLTDDGQVILTRRPSQLSEGGYLTNRSSQQQEPLPH